MNWILWSIWCLIIVLRYGGDNIKAMLVGVIMNLKNSCVEVCDSRSVHVWWTALWWSWRTILFIDCLPYEWRSGTSDGLFLPIYPPRSMRVVLWFLMTSKFFATSIWVLLINVESMDYTHSHPSTIASLSNTAHFSPLSYTHHIPSSKQPPYLPIMAFP